jgi:hypothetical protein
LRSDVAIVYGIDPKLSDRIQTWREHGYRIQVMTGVSWGSYQDYLYGRFDGIDHQDEAQTDRQGNKISHGGDVYYMCPGTNYGKFLCLGVQRALDAGAEAIHLEEPEFWVRGGYSEGFKREWRSYYHDEWQAPYSSVDAQWRASKLKYYLYRRALQQVFDYIQAYNQRTGRNVRCYVPTHSLLNYAHWQIVSPESSLARLKGCDGYIAQVWTGTSRTPNLYHGRLRERTFDTAFLEYGAMQNLVRATGRRVWYLNDPVEDNPNHDWDDYRANWESTLTASLFQPEVWRYEVAPWPERVFAGKYPRRAKPEERHPIPPSYATELQTVMNALNDMHQEIVRWDCGTPGLGVLVSDSLMFERGEPAGSDAQMSHFYGLALPLLKHGMPVTPVQMENLTVPHYLDGFRVLLLSYHGQKPLSPEIHAPLADWVRRGGVLVMVDDDSDPFNRVRDWWNEKGRNYSTPREHLFEQLGLAKKNTDSPGPARVGKGVVTWLHENPGEFAARPDGDSRLLQALAFATSVVRVNLRETNYLLVRRGPYIVAAGLEESIEGEPKVLEGRFVSLFDPELRIQKRVTLRPGSRFFLLDLKQAEGNGAKLLASACKAVRVRSETRSQAFAVEGVGNTPAYMLFRVPQEPKSVTLDSQPLAGVQYSKEDHLLRVGFDNEPHPRVLVLSF